MKKIIIHHRTKHHSSHSGYSRLLDYIEDAITIPKDLSNRKVPYNLAKFLVSKVNKEKGEYTTDSLEKEVTLFKTLMQYKATNNVVHYLNAERDIRFIINQKRLRNKHTFLGTFHKPKEILLKKITNPSTLKKLTGAICVGPNQIEFLKEWLQLENVKFIPHGIDLQYFKPNISKRKENNLVFVGQHLRDFKALNYCILKIAEKTPNLTVNVIVHKSYQKYIQPHPAINVFSNVDDIALKKFYQEATALFLPMVNSTACNSILEAMAMGLPIITNNVGGNYGYINSEQAIIAPKGEHDFMIDATIELLRDEAKIHKMSLQSLEQVKQFDWNEVAKQVVEFYRYSAVN